MRVQETPSFRRQVKRLRPNQKSDLDLAVRGLMDNPLAGELKRGDLAWARVLKCRLVGQLTLLAYEYRPVEDLIVLHAVGSHENFYRDLKDNPHPSKA